MIGWVLVNIPLESLTVGDWLRSLSWGMVALAAPILVAAAIVSGTAAPSIARVIGRRAEHVESFLALALGLTLIILTYRRRSASSSIRAIATFRSRR
jgi:hypothetical protein